MSQLFRMGSRGQNSVLKNKGNRKIQITRDTSCYPGETKQTKIIIIIIITGATNDVYFQQIGLTRGSGLAQKLYTEVTIQC